MQAIDPTEATHSIDPEIDAAAQYALRKIRRERKHKPISKQGIPEGTICHQGCCQFRKGYWICIA